MAWPQALWQTGWHEARLLAVLVDRPQWVTRSQMDRWTADFDSWDLCDQVCGNLWCRTPMAPAEDPAMGADEREFVRRAGFVTLAWMAVHDKKAPHDFVSRLSADHPRRIARSAKLREEGGQLGAPPDRQAVRVAARPCLELARELAASDDRTARWIGKDAVRELESESCRSPGLSPSRVAFAGFSSAM